MTELSPTIIWACIGIGLIIFEVFTTTFFLLFFGIAGIVVALIRVAGLIDHLPTEIIIFSVIGILGTLIFRKKMMQSIHSRNPVNIDVGSSVTVSEDIASKSEGSITYRGSPWKAFNNSDYSLKKGDFAIIENIEGVKIILNKK